MKLKLIVVSDNHGKVEPLEEILLRHQDADVFVHCGDSELPVDYLRGYACVRGNNDFYYDLPDMKILELEGHRVMIVHGHQHLYLGQLDILTSKAHRQGCDLVLFGHTHIFQDEEREGVRLVNPGALSRNRDGTPACYAMIEIQGDQITVQRMNRNQ